MMRKIFFMIMFLLVTSTIFAYTLKLNVVDDMGTKLVEWTEVSILDGNKTIYQRNTDDVNGSVSFEVDKGIYFIKLTRAGYPDHVMVFEVDKDIEQEVMMYKKKSTYILYGKLIGENISNWIGKTIDLLDEKNAKLKDIKIRGSRFFLMDYMYPDKTYKLRAGEGSDAVISAPFSYSNSGAFYIELNLKSNVFVEQKEKLSVPSIAKLYQPITVRIMAGDELVPNKTIIVNTPSGEITITTDSRGLAQVNAAESGDYIFRYKNQSEKTTVEGKREEEKIQEVVAPKEEKEDEVIDKINVNENKNKENKSSFVLLGVGAAGIILFLVVAFVILIIAYMIYKITNRSRGNKKSVEKKTKKTVVKKHHRKKKTK